MTKHNNKVYNFNRQDVQWETYLHLQISKHQVLNTRPDKWLAQMEVEIEITFLSSWQLLPIKKGLTTAAV